MDAKRKDDWRLAEEAASWLIRMEEDDSLACRTEFVAWAKTSPRQVQELLFAQAIWSEFSRIDPSRRIDLRELPTANEESVVALDVRSDPSKFHAPTREEQPRTVRRWAAVAAFIAVGSIAWAWLAFSGTPPQLYVTDHGGDNAIKLIDGSVMHLNIDSRARVQFSDDLRQVSLLSGEAFFLVEQDRERPFRVITQDATIAAVGTDFNVQRRTNTTRISVVEGVVEIRARSSAASAGSGRTPLQLAAGNEADVSHGKVVQSPTPDVKRAVAWRTPRLVFREARLEEVAAEFNRHNRVQIRLEGEDVRSRKMSGVFYADEPQSLVDYLAGEAELEVTQNGDEILIRLREGRR
jgi:transmembrane sensor